MDSASQGLCDHHGESIRQVVKDGSQCCNGEGSHNSGKLPYPENKGIADDPEGRQGKTVSFNTQVTVDNCKLKGPARHSNSSEVFKEDSGQQESAQLNGASAEDLALLFKGEGRLDLIRECDSSLGQEEISLLEALIPEVCMSTGEEVEGSSGVSAVEKRGHANSVVKRTGKPRSFTANHSAQALRACVKSAAKRKRKKSTKRVRCETCGYEAPSMSRLTCHHRTHTNEKPFACDKCSYTCATKSNLKAHFQVHTEEKPYACNYCDYRSKRRSHLDIHERRHTLERPFLCAHCPATFFRKDNLKIHVMKHELDMNAIEKPHACELCSFKTIWKHCLKMHMQSHLDERPFQCEHCPYKARRATHLREHLRYHTLERPYKCPHCSFMSASKSNLNGHLKTHSVDRPFTCPLCSYSGKLASRLRDHMRLHNEERPHRCTHCAFAATRKSNLNEHLKTHSLDRPYTCQSCPYRAHSTRNLKRHLRMAHKELAVDLASYKAVEASNDQEAALKSGGDQCELYLPNCGNV